MKWKSVKLLLGLVCFKESEFQEFTFLAFQCLVTLWKTSQRKVISITFPVNLFFAFPRGKCIPLLKKGIHFPLGHNILFPSSLSLTLIVSLTLTGHHYQPSSRLPLQLSPSSPFSLRQTLSSSLPLFSSCVSRVPHLYQKTLITLLSLASLSVPHLCSRQPNSLFPKPSTSPSRLSPPLASLSVPDTLSPLASLSPEVPSPLASLSPEVPLLLRISPPSANHSKRNQGSAEVLYTRRSDAFGAFKKYNNVLLDGKPMKIEIVGANPVVPISARMNVTGANGKKKRTFAMIPGLGGGRGAAVNNRGFGVHSRHQGGGDISTGTRNGRGRAPGRGRGRGRGRGKNQPGEKSVDELDKELESYHAEAMQT